MTSVNPDFVFYLDEEDEYLIVNKTLACAIGLNESIVLRKIHKWVKHNRKHNADKNFKDGTYWTFNTAAQWQEKEFEFWNVDTVRRTFANLEALGLLYVGNYNERKGDQTKWHTVNYGAYAAFLTLWINHKRPKAGNGRRSVAYKAFLEDWDEQRKAYTNLASCIDQFCKLHKADMQVAESVTNELTQQENTKEKDIAPARKKPAPKSTVIPFEEQANGRRKPYEDVSYDTRFGIINAWCSNLRAQPVGAFKKDDNHDTAAELHRAGYTEEQVAAFVQWARADTFWKDKTLKLQKVAELLPGWVAQKREAPPAPRQPVFVAPDTPAAPAISEADARAFLAEARRKVRSA